MPEFIHPVVGKVEWQHGAGDQVLLASEWRQRNLVTVHVPVLAGVATYGGPFKGDVPWYKPAAEQLLGAFAEIERKGLRKYLLFWDGSLALRLIRGSKTTPSNHCFGTAFDLNARWNSLGAEPAPMGAQGTVLPLVEVFKAWGFRWGGNYAKRPDGMHFEVGELLPPQPRLVLDGDPVEARMGLERGRLLAAIRDLAGPFGLAFSFNQEEKRVYAGKPGQTQVALNTQMRAGAAWVAVSEAARLARIACVWDDRSNTLHATTMV